MTLAQCVQTVIRRHGGLRVTSRVTGVDVAYLSRLASGQKHNPSQATMLKLGIDKTLVYRVRAKVREP